MSPLQQFTELVNDKFTDRHGRSHQVTKLKGLSTAEIGAMAQKLPGQRLPGEIEELLRFASGFDGGFFNGPVSFVNIDGFALEHFFPNLVELAGDGLGNYWLLDIDYQGNWGPVYFVCHEPAVIVKQAEGLAEFIRQIHEDSKDHKHSLFSQFYKGTPDKIWKLKGGGFKTIDEARVSGDHILKGFASKLPSGYLIADLRNQPVGTGFAWGKYFSIMDKEVRCGDLPLWAIQPKKRGFFARIFGIR